METIATTREGLQVFQGRKTERGVNQIEIEGCMVEFPFEPYDCQKDYMAQVIRALKQGSNALLESPTGTGKTLCLLCATLAWRESLKGSAGSLALAQSAQPALLQGGSSTHPSGSTAPGASLVERELGMSVDPALAHLPPAMQLVLSARGPQGAATSHAGFEPNGGAGGAGAAAGSGGGSTHSARLPTIVYSSRTHSQLAQVIQELQRCSYRDRVRSTILSSRAQSCLHPKVSKMSGGQANQACRMLTSQKKCGWYNNLKYSRSKDWSSLLDPVPDMEDLLRTGRQHSLCAFYMGKDAAKDADVVFLPYNYLLDPNIRKTMVDSVNWENAVVIFDEAHNVEGVCSDASSFDITAKHLTDAMLEARRCKEACLAFIEQGLGGDTGGQDAGGLPQINYRQLCADLDLLMGVLKAVESGLHAQAQNLGKDGVTRPGVYLFEFLSQFRITEATLPVLNTTIDRSTSTLQAWEMEQGGGGGGGSNSKSSTPALQHLQDSLNLAFNTLSPLNNRKDAPPAHKGYRVHIHMERSWGVDKVPAPTLSFWCFIPGMAMRMLSALQMRSILLTSGTLSPLDSFAHELQLPFNITLENPHIVQQSQVWVGVLPMGPSGHPLCSSFKDRDTKEYKEDLGAAVVNFARIVPDGLLVFFPSYSVLNTCIEYWKTANPGGGPCLWERIISHKAPVIEPRDSNMFAQAIEDYKQKLDNPATSGAVFFAVCRGKVSEGLDFSDRAGRGVIITGIPFAVATDPKVRLKRDVLDEERRSAGFTSRGGGSGGGLSGEAWYLQQAMRAVNQAMGRVIRHRWDYGAIILADKRFGDANTQKSLSKWLQSYVQSHGNFGSAAASLTQFFKDKADFKGAAAAAKPKGSAFQLVTGASSTAGASSSKAAGGSGSAGNLLDLVPSAADASGFGSGAGHKPRSTKPMSSMRGNSLGQITGKHDALMSMLEEGGAAGKRPGSLGSAAAGQQQQAGLGQGSAGTGLSRLDTLLLSSNVPGSGAGSAGAGGGGGSRAGGKPPVGWAVGGVPRPAVPRQPSQGRGARSSLSIEYDSGPNSREPSPGMDSLQGSQGGCGSDADGEGPCIRQLDRAALGGGPAGGPVGEVIAVGPASRMQRRLAQQQGVGQQETQQQENAACGQEEAGVRGSCDSGVIGVTGARVRDVSPQPVTASTGLQQPQQQQVVIVQKTALGTLAVKQEGQQAAGGGGGGAGQPGSRAGSVPPPAGGAAGAVGRAKPDPKAFISQLKASLPRPVFDQVQQLLKQYGEHQDAQRFMEGLVAALKGPRTVHHLSGFVDFIPKQQRAWFSEVVKTHIQRYEAKPTSSAQSGGQPGKPGQGKTSSGGPGQQKQQTLFSVHQRLFQPVAGAVVDDLDDEGAHITSGRSSKVSNGGDGGVSSAKGAGGAAAASHSRAAGKAPPAAAGPLDLLGGSRQGSGMPVGGPLGAPKPGSMVGKPSAAGGAGLAAVGRASAQPVTGVSSGSSRPVPSSALAASGGGKLPGGASSSAGPGGGLVPVKREVPRARLGEADAGAVAGLKKARVTAAGPPGEACCMCGTSPMDVPYSAPCGHTGCRQCWQVQIAQHFRCPKCSREVRQKNLTRKFFA